MALAPVILGTAGHIDHGKSSLIKALTGIDPDRLKEEKLRGITIELGFASLILPTGQVLGIVDVPGHERFVRHMVAGASGMDLVALVIAADEGVMPQTREHLEICELLQVKRGLVVLTKIDLVEPEWLDLVEEEIREFLAGTFLEGAPVVRFSAVTGEGKDTLIATLAELAREVPPKPAGGIFRLPIDRVFTIKGFGTVVTGTVSSGRLQVGEPVMVYPPRCKARVRTLQVHGKSVPEIQAGNRAAINLQGLEKEELERGMVVATPGVLIPSRRLDAVLQILPSAPRPLKHRQAVRFHTGTSERVGVALLLEAEELAPGSRGYVQFLLRDEVAVKPGDRFVIRNLSPAVTWGGGQILRVNPPKHKRRQERVLKALRTLETGGPEEHLRVHLEEAGAAGLSLSQLAALLPWEEKEIGRFLNSLSRKGEAFCFDPDHQRYLLTATAKVLEGEILRHLEEFHHQNPLKPGLSKEELRKRLPAAVEGRLFNELLASLGQKQRVVVDRDLVRLATHKVQLAEGQQETSRRLEELYRQHRLSPPTLKELGGLLKLPLPQLLPLLEVLVNEGKLVKVTEELYFHHEALRQLRETLVTYLKEKGAITTPEFKNLTQTSRKFTIPLLEYFDATRVTIRIGDTRRLREGAG